VAIDLKEVLFVDREAVNLLAFSESNRTELRNWPGYIREWVDRERTRLDTGPLEPKTGGTVDNEDI